MAKSDTKSNKAKNVTPNTSSSGTNAFLAPVKFAGEVQREVKKVTWPTRRETVLTTIMVFVLVFIMALFLFSADQIIAAVIKMILQVKS